MVNTVTVAAIQTLDDLKPSLTAHSSKVKAVAYVARYFLTLYQPDLLSRPLVTMRLTNALSKSNQWYDEKLEIVANVYELEVDQNG